MAKTDRIWAETALLGDGWADSVEIEIGDDGDIGAIRTDTPYLSGERAAILLPAMPNVHSHAHQRAMAGLSERTADGDDSFWSWRQVMYHYLQRIEPEHLQRIAAQLYVEMLKAGYGAVGEFQYLHHDLDGRAYGNRAEMSLQCLEAARRVGIGFTALPVLYRYGGFGGAEPLAAQRRFLNDADGFVDIVEALQQASRGDANSAVGIAPHSLRAISRELLTEVDAGLQDLAAIHIHIAEQIREVDDCVAWSGRRPVEWLFDNFEVDGGWCLIHATHMTAAETAKTADSGCIAGLCPTTEANLGDGFFNLIDYADHGGSVPTAISRSIRSRSCAGSNTACACRPDAATCWPPPPVKAPGATCSTPRWPAERRPADAPSAPSKAAGVPISWCSMPGIRGFTAAAGTNSSTAGYFPAIRTWCAMSTSAATR